MLFSHDLVAPQNIVRGHQSCCCSDVISSSKRPSLLSQVRLQHSGGQEYLNNDTKAWGVLMSGQRRSSCCNLSDGKRNGTSNARQYTSRLKHMSYTSNKKMKVRSAHACPTYTLERAAHVSSSYARVFYIYNPFELGSDAKKKDHPIQHLMIAARVACYVWLLLQSSPPSPPSFFAGLTIAIMG